MRFGNENLALDGNAPVRIIVLQLLNDAGIPGYGHRYNLLDAQWTHVACYATRESLMTSKWWIQNFGVKIADLFSPAIEILLGFTCVAHFNCSTLAGSHEQHNKN